MEEKSEEFEDLYNQFIEEVRSITCTPSQFVSALEHFISELKLEAEATKRIMDNG